VNWNEFESALVNLKEDGNFSFGFNWIDYAKNRLNEAIISQHLSDLAQIYNEIDNRGALLDLGSGSGLSSLCFLRLGFNSVTSVDLDPYSIEAGEATMERFGEPYRGRWNTHQANILDPLFVAANSNKYDVVYSWGVLHHTGDMWQAIRNAASLVANKGIFHITLYRSGGMYTQHLRMKFAFLMSDREGKKRILFDYLNLIEKTVNHSVFLPKDHRGMNHFNDALDWLGGVPYEVADPDVLQSYLFSLGFQRIHFRENVEGGPFLDIYRKR
jgi:2-polyprenyl-3-methyl-5-hydroxy-6-metoxy-1,4-benzoquinol methylase